VRDYFSKTNFLNEMNLDCNHKHQQRMLKEIGVKMRRSRSMTNIVRTRSLRLGRNWLDRSNNQADPEVAKQLASAPAGVGLVTAGIRTLRVGGL